MRVAVNTKPSLYQSASIPCFVQRTGLSLLMTAALVGCSAGDVGVCDQEALTVVSHPSLGTAYAGQAMVDATCGAGSLCHSEGAEGGSRVGVPHGLNFDMRPPRSDAQDELIRLRRGEVNVRKWRKQIWSEVDSERMPPEGNSREVPSAWIVQSSGVSAASGADGGVGVPPVAAGDPLPGLDTAEGKEILRNWLACNAPVIADPAPVGAAQPTWAWIHDNIITGSGGCTACHGLAPASAGQGFSFGQGSACESLQAVRDVAAITGECADASATLVVPDDPDNSLLLQKLLAQSSADVCGDPMPPPAGGLNAEEIEAVRQWIADGAPAPEDCPTD